MADGSVLVVDDERNIRMTLRAALEGVASEVREAPDGERGLAELRARPADVVLLDLRMPGIDGLEVLQRLRAGSPATRVVVITAHGTVDAAVSAMKLGAADFLQKPFEPSQVRSVVSALLRSVAAGGAAATGGPGVAQFVADARRFARAGRDVEADAAARNAVAAAPGDAEPLFLLGVARDLRGDRLGAQSYYRAAIALRGSFEHAHRNLARSVEGPGSRPLLYGDETLGPR